MTPKNAFVSLVLPAESTGNTPTQVDESSMRDFPLSRIVRESMDAKVMASMIYWRALIFHASVRLYALEEADEISLLCETEWFNQ